MHMAVTIKKLEVSDLDDFTALVHVFENVFEVQPLSAPDPARLGELLTRQDFIALVARAEQEVVGGLTAYLLPQYYPVKPHVYLYELAIIPDFQRQGIGRQLVDELLRYCHQIGAGEVFVQAEAIDKHAIEFYRTTGGIPMKVFHFSYPLKD